MLQDCGSTVVVLIRALAPMLHARSPVAREATGTRSHASRPTSTSCTSFWSSWNQHDAAPLKPKLSIVEPDRRKGRSFSAYRVHAPRRRLDQWCRAASCRSIAKHHHADIQAHPTQRRPAGIHNPPAAVVVQGKYAADGTIASYRARDNVNGKHDVRGVDYWGAAENTSLNLTTWKRYMRMTLIHLTYKSTMMTPPTYDPPSQG